MMQVYSIRWLRAPTIPKGRELWATQSLAKFRHSITDTDYEVEVVAAPAAALRGLSGDARWFEKRQWEKLALTGLTRKILRKLADATNPLMPNPMGS